MDAITLSIPAEMVETVEAVLRFKAEHDLKVAKEQELRGNQATADKAKARSKAVAEIARPLWEELKRQRAEEEKAKAERFAQAKAEKEAKAEAKKQAKVAKPKKAKKDESKEGEA